MSTTAKPPSDKQMRYLRNLASQRGESFTYPATAAQASAEIERLKDRRRGSYVERRIERQQVSRDLAFSGDAASVRGTEITGYGSSARWKAGSR
jgi:hypothetical protein